MTKSKKSRSKKMTPAQREAYKAEKQEQVKGLLDQLHAGVAKLSSSEEWKALLRFQGNFHRYSFNNMMLIYMQNPAARAVAGYKAWQKMGRQVRKGEKGLTILAPSPRKFTREDKNGNEEEVKYMTFRAVKVFDISQTDGPELPQDKLCKLLTGFDDEANGMFEVLREYAETSLGYTVSVVDAIKGHSTALGICRYADQAIEIVQGAPLQMAQVLAHEIGHATMHREESEFEHVMQDYREVEAESFAYCVLGAFGLDTSDMSFGYVAGWSGGDPKKVETSGARIQKAVTKVLGDLEDQVEIARLRAENALLKAA